MLIEVRVLRVIMRSRHALIHDKRDACRSSMIATHRSGCLFIDRQLSSILYWWSAIIELFSKSIYSYIIYKAVDASTGFFGGYI